MKRWELITTLGAATVLVAMISSFAFKWGEADRAESFARSDTGLQHRFMEPALAAAEIARMQRNESRFLADLARQYQMRGDAGTALLLALESLPGGASGKVRVTAQSTGAVAAGADDIDRVYVPGSELQLDGAWRALRELHVLVWT
jgi:hypothetical protein